MESPGDADAEGNPDVWDLFRHYDKLYFRGALVDAAFTVEWTSPRMKTIRYLLTSCLLLLLRWFLRPCFFDFYFWVVGPWGVTI